jgi:hypothetical protein
VLGSSGGRCQTTTDLDGNWLVVWGRTTGIFQAETRALRGVGPCPSAYLTITATNPAPSSHHVDLTATGFTPANSYFTCFTYEPGEHPAGSWFGIDPLYSELAIQASTLAPPFNGTFDAAGTLSYSWSWSGTPGPMGITLYAVTIEHLAGHILRASPPIATSL